MLLGDTSKVVTVTQLRKSKIDYLMFLAEIRPKIGKDVDFVQLHAVLWAVILVVKFTQAQRRTLLLAG